jgi:hypothetical protein
MKSKLIFCNFGARDDPSGVIKEIHFDDAIRLDVLISSTTALRSDVIEMVPPHSVEIDEYIIQYLRDHYDETARLVIEMAERRQMNPWKNIVITKDNYDELKRYTQSRSKLLKFPSVDWTPSCLNGPVNYLIDKNWQPKHTVLNFREIYDIVTLCDLLSLGLVKGFRIWWV